MKTSVPRPNERGVALLLTLGILSLLLIMTMSFAFTARTELLASEVNADMIKARLLCESGLERVLGLLSHSFNGSNPEDVFPATSGELFTYTNAASGAGSQSEWEGRSYMFSTRGPAASVDTAIIEDALATRLGAFDFIPKRTNNQITAGNEIGEDLSGNQLSWHHVEDGGGDLIGRMAFIVVDESGKLDPGALVTHHEPFNDANSNGTFDSGEEYFDINGNNAFDADEPYVDDNGNGSFDTGEPYLDVDGDGNYTNSVVQEGDEVRVGLHPQEIDLGSDDYRTAVPLNPATGRPIPWLSWVHMYNKLGTAPVEVFFPRSKDIEAWNDGGTDRHRYDLRNANWSAPPPTTVTVANVQADADAFFAADGSVTAPGGGIPWIADIVAQDGSTSLADQVAANLIDYCDGDDNPTNDYSSLSSVNYCGLEEVVFINEVLLRVKMASVPAVPGDRRVTVTPLVELINIWGSDLAARKIEMEVDLEFSDNTVPTTETPTLTWNQSLTPAQGTVAANSYAEISLLGSQSHSWTTAADEVQDFKVTAVRIALGRTPGAIVTGTLWDVSAIGPSATVDPLRSVDAPAPAGTEQETTAEVQDPRANRRFLEWAWRPYAALNTYAPLGSVNSNSNPSTSGDDTETATTDPANGVSTAFIANDDMQNLWELGAIHRGEAWRTLNLKGYHQTSGTYANGDGRILDQVKIGSQTEMKGRVNANSPVSAVWEFALNEIQVGTAYDSPGTGGAAITAPANVAAGILAVNGGTGGGAYGGRGGFCRATELTDATCGVVQDTDREQEEIIGKIAHLLTVRQNYFNVIVVAQALKDTGTIETDQSINVDPSSADGHFVNILAEQKIKAVVYRDAFRNTYEVKRYEFLAD